MRFAGSLLALTLLAGNPATAQESAPYSIQVRAVPIAEKAEGMATYRMLRDRGYLVYHYAAESKNEPWLRIAVGAFDSSEAAAAFGKSFSANEGLDHFVARAPVSVTPGRAAISW